MSVGVVSDCFDWKRVCCTWDTTTWTRIRVLSIGNAISGLIWSKSFLGIRYIREWQGLDLDLDLDLEEEV